MTAFAVLRHRIRKPVEPITIKSSSITVSTSYQGEASIAPGGSSDLRPDRFNANLVLHFLALNRFGHFCVAVTRLGTITILKTSPFGRQSGAVGG